ncbi:MAG: hypothetical protein ACJ8ER_03925 [Allosphingosinicella sp.]
MARRTTRGRQRVSQFYRLGRTQGGLDFVDVDIANDTPLFLSPRALELLPSDWGDECVSLVQNFFQTVLDLIKAGKNREAENLLATLKEPNETHLGLSRGKSRGRALGTGSAHLVWRAMSQSAAARTGLLRDLEDAVLLIPGVGVDIISDMTTNIIRAPLIEYTQRMANQVGIPLIDNVDSGPMWDPGKRKWFSRYEQLPVTTAGKLLLVPKVIVRADLQYRADQYYRHYILTHLRQMELAANSALVEVLKNGRRRVTKKALIAKYGSGKQAVVEQTLQHPQLLDQYRAAMAKEDYSPLSHRQMAEIENTEGPDWDALLASVLDIPTGNADATKYERAVEALMTALFHPDLTNPIMQYAQHEGRKRVDIRYTNMARAGFFQWLSRHYPSSQVWIECKNYKDDIANNELDQLAGRFSPGRGQVGLLVSRRFDDKALFLKRCRDTARDGRGYIITLDDADLKALIEFRKAADFYQQWTLLMERFEALIN